MKSQLISVAPFFVTIIFLIIGCHRPDSSQEVGGQKVVTSETIIRIDSTLAAMVREDRVAGVSALIYEDGTEAYYGAFGYADREQEVPMKRNTIVQLWSNTKPVTAASLMSLVESGKIQLSDPVEKYLPEFEGIMVYDGLDADGNILTVPPTRKMIIADLTRHTAGFCNNPNVPGLSDLIAEIDPRSWENDLDKMVSEFASIPLWSHPGARWEYGPGMDIEAALIQRVSGQPYHEYLRKHILDPLGLEETRYFVPEEDRSRLSKVYGPDNDGNLVRIPDSSALSYPTRHWPMKAGGFGLTSTIDEYMRYARMLLNQGEIDGVRVLSKESVKTIGTDHLPDTITQRSWLPSKGQVGFGVNVAVRIAPPQTPEENKGAVGEFFWDGAATTLMWVDPANDLAAVLFVQKIPFDGSLHKDFREAVYADREDKK